MIKYVSPWLYSNHYDLHCSFAPLVDFSGLVWAIAYEKLYKPTILSHLPRFHLNLTQHDDVSDASLRRLPIVPVVSPLLFSLECRFE